MAGATAHTAAESLVQEERSGGVVTLRLNRPEKLNALIVEMAQALLQGLAAREDDNPVRAVVIAGDGARVLRRRRPRSNPRRPGAPRARRN